MTDTRAPLAPTTGRTSTTQRPFGWRFVVPLMSGSTLNPINSSMLATALVGIGLDFDKGPGATASLVSVLYLCCAVAQPTMGKLAQVFGPRRVFATGVALLLVAGALGAAAQEFWMLLVSRALIGIGTSAAYPTAMALIRKRADDEGTGVPSRVIANLSIAAQSTMLLGLPLGGLLAGTFGWRAIFFINVPWAAITLVLLFLGVAKDTPLPREGVRALMTKLDVPGIVMFAGTIVTLLLFLAAVDEPRWTLLAASAALCTALVTWERRAGQPLIDVRMLARNGPLVRTYVRQTLVALGTYTAMYGVTQWMEGAAGYDTTEIGLMLIPLAGMAIVSSKVSSLGGWIRWPLVTSGAALVLAAAMMLTVSSSSGIVALIAMTLLFGIADGSNIFANQTSLYLQSPADTLPVASGLLRTFNYLGAIFSASLIGLAFGDSASDHGLHVIAWVIAGIGAAVIAMTLLDRRIPQSTSS